MTERRPGQWPVDRPAHLTPVPDDEQPPQVLPLVEVPVPDVRLVVTVDLTGRYSSSSEVTGDLYEQTRRSSDCHTAIVRCGEDALTHSLGLAHQIAGQFFLSARRIEVHVPAGTRHAYLASEVQRHLALMCADHARTIAHLRAPG